MARDVYLDGALILLLEDFITTAQGFPDPAFPLTPTTAIQYVKGVNWKQWFDANPVDPARRALCQATIKAWFDGEADNNPPPNDEINRAARFVNACDALRTLKNLVP